MSIRLIRCNNSDPVTPFDDAVVFHSAKGHDYTGDKRGGVFEKVYDGMGYIRDNVNHKFIVRSGMAMLYGRQFEIPQNETIEFNVSSLTGKYCVVYIEVTNSFIDMTGETDENDEPIPSYDEITINAQLVYASEGYPSIGNTDIIANRYGTATMELYRFYVNGSGEIGDVIDRRYIYLPGVAERARVMDGSGIVNNRRLDNLIYPDKDLVRNTDHAYYADRASSLGTTGDSVTRNKITDNLFLENKNAYLLTTKVLALKTSGTWNAGSTHTVNGLPTSVKGSLVHVELCGSDNSAASGYVMSSTLGGSTSSVNFSLVCNGTIEGSSGNQIEITVNNGTATIKNGSTRSISGTLYLILFIAGGGV